MVDVSLRRGFINNGDIEVDNESSDEENQANNEVLVKPSRLHFLDNWSEDPFVKSSAFERRKINTYTVDDEEEHVVYRLSERGLVLDFIDKVNLLPHTRKRAPKPFPLSELDSLVLLPYSEREFVRNLAYFNQQDTPEAITRQNISSLIDAALSLQDPVPLSPADSDSNEVMEDAPGISNQLSLSLPASVENMPAEGQSEVSDDREALLAIQKLMKVKGRDALMKFLLSELTT